MSKRVPVFAIFALACVSSATAGELYVDQPVVMSAPTVWPSSPIVTRRPQVLIMEARPRAVAANKDQVYTPLPHPGYAPTVTYRPLAPLMPVPQRYYFGRGIIGQPKIYVPDQPIRNFLRYLTL